MLSALGGLRTRRKRGLPWMGASIIDDGRTNGFEMMRALRTTRVVQWKGSTPAASPLCPTLWDIEFRRLALRSVCVGGTLRYL